MDGEEHIRRWQAAGFIDEATAARLLAHEGGTPAEPATAASERPGALEALLYLGLAAAAAGIIVLVAMQWSELRPWSRMAVAGIPCVLALMAGGAMLRSDEGGIRRAGTVAWFVAAALTAVTLAIGAEEYGPGFEDAEAWVLLGVAGGTVAMAAVLWLLSPTHPQVLAMGGSLLFMGTAVGNWPDEYSTGLFGFTVMLFGAAGVALAEAGWLAPRISARFVFAMLAVLGPFIFGMASDAAPVQLVIVAVGAVLAGLSVWRAVFVYMGVGVGAIFVGLVAFFFRQFAPELGAPVALILTGALLIAVVLVLAQARRVMRARRRAA
ncbi:MAG: DUF2157 domain-containing protein [Dehalococcoidia bacterium]|nr:DUF2157 domain-containing protein [Dehalococcoidia bacterium]